MAAAAAAAEAAPLPGAGPSPPRIGARARQRRARASLCVRVVSADSVPGSGGSPRKAEPAAAREVLHSCPACPPALRLERLSRHVRVGDDSDGQRRRPIPPSGPCQAAEGRGPAVTGRDRRPGPWCGQAARDHRA